MANVVLTFNEPLNVSVQIGDIVYYVNPDEHGSIYTIWSGKLSNVIRFGKIIEITNQYGLATNADLITITVLAEQVPPNMSAFIMFAKDKSINTSSLVGYYAKVKFVNNSTEKIELFGVGSEFFESSK